VKKVDALPSSSQIDIDLGVDMDVEGRVVTNTCTPGLQDVDIDIDISNIGAKRSIVTQNGR